MNEIDPANSPLAIDAELFDDRVEQMLEVYENGEDGLFIMNEHDDENRIFDILEKFTAESDKVVAAARLTSAIAHLKTITAIHRAEQELKYDSEDDDDGNMFIRYSDLDGV